MHYDAVSSMTAISVPSGSRAARDRFRSFNFCIGALHRVHISDDGMQYPRRRPIASSIMGFEDEAEQSFGRPCRQSNGRNQADIRTHLIHRPARDILPPVDLRLPPDALILGALHAAAVSLVQWNSVPSIQMRCRITANRRAKATIAFFIPRRLAICMAQALSQDHFFERSMLCAAS